jgi:O-antigen ligase
VSTAEIALPRPRARSQESGFPRVALFPLALIPFFGTSPEGLQVILLTVQALLFFLGVRRPVWILAAIMVSELTIANYIYEFGSFGISNRLVLTLASIPVVLPHVVQRPDLGPRAKSMVLTAVAFFLIATFANVVASDMAYVFKFSRYLITGLIALVLVPAVVRSRDDVRDLSLVVLVISAISALVAVLQHYSQITGAPLYEAIPHAGLGPDTFESWGGRALGLTESPIYITSALLFSMMFLLGAVLLADLEPRVRFLLTAILMMTAAALFFSYTRSWAYSAGFALLPMVLAYRGRYSRELWLLVIFAGAAFFYYSDLQSNRYTLDANSDDSAATRPVLWEVGLNIALDNPILGVGHDKFLELSPEYASRIDRSLLDRQGAGSALGQYQPHNDFLNVWLSFGTGALVLYVGLFLLSIKNYLEAFFRTTEPLVKGLALGGMGAVLAFGANSFFHNLFDSTLTIWLLAGISLALSNLVMAESSAVTAVVAPPRNREVYERPRHPETEVVRGNAAKRALERIADALGIVWKKRQHD